MHQLIPACTMDRHGFCEWAYAIAEVIAVLGLAPHTTKRLIEQHNKAD